MVSYEVELVSGLLSSLGSSGLSLPEASDWLTLSTASSSGAAAAGLSEAEGSADPADEADTTAA